jgi:adenylate cyclase
MEALQDDMVMSINSAGDQQSSPGSLSASLRSSGIQAVAKQVADDRAYAAVWNGIRVRVGIHFGVGSVKFDPTLQGYDYYGTLVNTAARVEGVGNGGQVLLTKDAYDAVEAEGFDLSAVVVEGLGPQPLRGLDAPVPLYQLNPPALKGRQFAALRLDIEKEAVDDDTMTATNDGTDNGTNASVNETPDGRLQRLVASRRHLADLATNAVQFLDLLLKSSPFSWRKETLKSLMKRWHVQPRKSQGAAISDELQLQHDLVSLSIRVAEAQSEARKAQRSAMEMAMSSSSALGMAGGSMIRRQSMSTGAFVAFNSGRGPTS